MANKQVSDAMHKIFSDAGKKGNRSGKSMGGKHSVVVRNQKRLQIKALEELKIIVQNSINNILLGASLEISQDLKKMSYLYIEDFYSSYDPKYYKRRFNLGSSVTQVSKLRGNNMSYAGVVISPIEYTSDLGDINGLMDSYNQDPVIVFEKVLEQGLHGKELENVSAFSPSVIERLDSYYKAYNVDKVMKKWINKYLPQRK